MNMLGMGLFFGWCKGGPVGVRGRPWGCTERSLGAHGEPKGSPWGVHGEAMGTLGVPMGWEGEGAQQANYIYKLLINCESGRLV